MSLFHRPTTLGTDCPGGSRSSSRGTGDLLLHLHMLLHLSLHLPILLHLLLNLHLLLHLHLHLLLHLHQHLCSLVGHEESWNCHPLVLTLMSMPDLFGRRFSSQMVSNILPGPHQVRYSTA